MVVLFSEQDMLSFGEYMISDYRAKYITEASKDESEEVLKERLKTSYAADLAEWTRLEQQNQQNNA